jgi:hypothetical protein
MGTVTFGWAILILGPLMGCAGQGQLTDIDGRIAVDERRAANLRADLLQQETSLKKLAECTKWAETHALAARIDADAARALSDCALKDARFHACEAQQEKHKASGAGWGCLLGGGAALITGGALAPLALAGCGAGYVAGAATTQDCGASEPNCDLVTRDAVTSALKQEGLTQIPKEGPMPPWCAQFDF